MKLLLDTHSFLWFVLDDPKLPLSARRLIETSTSQVCVSPVSFWETGIRVSKVSVLPIEIAHAARLTSLPFHHRDPFDRMLVAQALAEDLTLVSNDIRLDAYGVRRVW